MFIEEALDTPIICLSSIIVTYFFYLFLCYFCILLFGLIYYIYCTVLFHLHVISCKTGRIREVERICRELNCYAVSGERLPERGQA